ncbi:sodium/proton antiporter, NhaD family [Sulfurivirga caldicuralii]|uniref:Sodium/proton antiporter, NhaD family n=1 Tax=Sulfurivirga caldicuralii TaxID=364032 RepID=A0A1N6HBW6_9GAMM|nr:sodium:proton antiporter NhaD [Sulfurivirga caldicuralii]SIO17149.1 sodium/proton antiporter, NhaD family [Sulfurivirga caldicuralii]
MNTPIKSPLGAWSALSLVLLLPFAAIAAEMSGHHLDLSHHWVGYVSLAIFVIAYAVVMVEEVTHLRKSKPVVLAAGLIWALIAWVYNQHGMGHVAEEAVRHNILEYAELFLFLLAAMAYINAMDERNVFNALRGWLVAKGFTYRQLFWITGFLAFFISPVADNLTTALLMGAVILAVGKDSPQFVALAFINLVVAANAGGAFSPFGDITTLMVWQKGVVQFHEFFDLFVPSLVNFVVPAAIMHFAIPKSNPKKLDEHIQLKRGALAVVVLFFVTIAMAVSFHNFLSMPPVLGMMTGLSLLMFYGYYLKVTGEKEVIECVTTEGTKTEVVHPVTFDIFNKIARAEWDTLLFFFGVILAVGGLGTIGYLDSVSHLIYDQWGALWANVSVGILSSLVDNIPVMFAVLTMMPDMSHGDWLLVTLTAGVGGSLLSIGSAAGVALMGQSKGMYTFMSHLKWTPVVALGYAASILAHLWINADLFRIPAGG